MTSNKIFELIGLAGASIVMVSNVPQLVLFWQQKHAKGISVLGNWVGLVGVGLRTIYLWHSTHGDVISLAPYFFAITCILYTKYFIYFPKEDARPHGIDISHLFPVNPDKQDK